MAPKPKQKPRDDAIHERIHFCAARFSTLSTSAAQYCIFNYITFTVVEVRRGRGWGRCTVLFGDLCRSRFGAVGGDVVLRISNGFGALAIHVQCLLRSPACSAEARVGGHKARVTQLQHTRNTRCATRRAVRQLFFSLGWTQHLAVISRCAGGQPQQALLRKVPEHLLPG